ncbi:MAG: MBL fold metallo-hydrolase [Planctomycetota bacterium]
MPEHTLRFATLASGSSGNVIYCETVDGAILIDAGISAVEVDRRLRQVGGDIGRIEGMILTHMHIDHVRSAGTLSRRHGIPLFMTHGTHRACAAYFHQVSGLRLFEPGSLLCLGGFHIQCVLTPHDAPESVALVLQRGATRLGLFTDLGHCFEGIGEIVSTLDAILIESNYDPGMLRRGGYPETLKARILGPRGHLSNEEAAALIRDHAAPRLQAILLGHLSENNNVPDLALDCFRRVAGDFLKAHRPILAVAPRHAPSALFVIRPRREKKDPHDPKEVPADA